MVQIPESALLWWLAETHKNHSKCLDYIS